MADKKPDHRRVEPANISRPQKLISHFDEPRRRGKASRCRKKRRFEKSDLEKLPTPPPDPFPKNVFDETFSARKNSEGKKNDIHDYLEDSRASSRSVIAARFPCTEEAFDHLEKLYNLIEQILELRDRNSKLFKRVRELERLKVLGKAHREVEQNFLRGNDLFLPDENVDFAESLLGAMLQMTGPEIAGNRGRSSFRSTPMRQRSRSIGIEHPAAVLKRGSHLSSAQSVACKKRNSVIGGPKVSKWTKVKAAFKWERAGAADLADADVSRYLRIPENSESSTTASGSSPRTEISGPPTPATLSSSSSTDDVYHGNVTRFSQFFTMESVFLYLWRFLINNIYIAYEVN